MRKLIPAEIKQLVAKRANYKCEYCLLPEKVSFYNFQIDHIISIKHGGNNDINNLAFCCPDCNYSKSTDIGSILNNNNVIVRFYNPHLDVWNECFEMVNGTISAKNDIGKVTEKIYKFNDIDRLIFRNELINMGQY